MNDRNLINALLNRLGGTVTLTSAELDRAKNPSTLQTESFSDGSLIVTMIGEQAIAGGPSYRAPMDMAAVVTPMAEVDDQ